MINFNRPLPLLAPPPPAPLPPPQQAGFVAPVGAAAWPSPQAAWPPPKAPQSALQRVLGLNWDPLAELVLTVLGTPALALVGAGIGLMIAGPIGAARGAMIGAALPGTVFAGYELTTRNPWWGNPGQRVGPFTLTVLLSFPALSGIGYGVGLAIAGATGAAWGTLIAAALPVTVMTVAAVINRLVNPPVYDPGPVVPAPTRR